MMIESENFTPASDDFILLSDDEIDSVGGAFNFLMLPLGAVLAGQAFLGGGGGG